MSKIGELMYQKRKELHMTQEELAEKIGVTDGYISKIELGYQQPGFETLSKIGKELNIDETELFRCDTRFLSVLANIGDRIGEYDKEFKILRPRIKDILLELAPILEKYV